MEGYKTMTTTNRSTEHELTHVAHYQQHARDLVIRVIHSESGHDYHVTIFKGKVSSCEQANGDICKGWRYRHSCHHATLAQQLEAERDEERTRYNYYMLSIVEAA
jgi:hypothetical protein